MLMTLYCIVWEGPIPNWTSPNMSPSFCLLLLFPINIFNVLPLDMPWTNSPQVFPLWTTTKKRIPCHHRSRLWLHKCNFWATSSRHQRSCKSWHSRGHCLWNQMVLGYLIWKNSYQWTMYPCWTSFWFHRKKSRTARGGTSVVVFPPFFLLDEHLATHMVFTSPIHLEVPLVLVGGGFIML